MQPHGAYNASRVGVPVARKGVDTSNSVRSVETMPLKTLADVMILRQSCHTMQSQDTSREKGDALIHLGLFKNFHNPHATKLGSFRAFRRKWV
jgi:hypothetical protein